MTSLSILTSSLTCGFMDTTTLLFKAFEYKCRIDVHHLELTRTWGPNKPVILLLHLTFYVDVGCTKSKKHQFNAMIICNFSICHLLPHARHEGMQSFSLSMSGFCGLMPHKTSEGGSVPGRR
jgi:hypothetical protein